MKISKVPAVSLPVKTFCGESDPFDALNSRIYPRTLKNKAFNEPVRLWVRGCSTEEVLCPDAINMAERLGKRGQKTPSRSLPANVNRLMGKKSRAVRRSGKPMAEIQSNEELQTELFDIRDRQRSESSAKRLAALMHDNSDAVIIRDLKDRIIAWNRGAQIMYGYTEEEALGMNIRRLIPKNVPARARELIRLSAQGAKSEPLETRRRTKDGRMLDVLLTITVLLDEKGQLTEIATTERDITEQKRADRELRRLHARVIYAQETERRRLARELHDGVSQILSGVKFRLDSLPENILLRGKAAAKLLKVRNFLDRAILEIRRVSKNLMPPELEDLGLEPAMRTLCREFNERGGIDVKLRTWHIPVAVSPELALALYRIAQEALNNIGKHSMATMAAIDLSGKGSEILLNVSDNGIGFTTGGVRAQEKRGIGLGSMRERAESVGGFLELRSAPGCGTTLGVHAPICLPAGGAV